MLKVERNTLWDFTWYPSSLTKVTSTKSFYFLRFQRTNNVVFEVIHCKRSFWDIFCGNNCWRAGEYFFGCQGLPESWNLRYSLFCLARYHEFFLAMTIFILTWLGWLDGDRWQLETFPPNTRGRVVSTCVLTYLMFVSFGTPSHYLGL